MGNAPAIHPPGDRRNVRRRDRPRRQDLSMPHCVDSSDRRRQTREWRPPVEDDHKREDDWFRANEKKLIEEARLARERREKERAQKEAASEIERLRQLHFMKCP